MVCIFCGADTEVTNSRPQKRNNQIWRRRRCKACYAVFTTNESIDLSKSLIVHKNGLKEPFLTDLLYTELLLALQDRKDCYEAAREANFTVIRELIKSSRVEPLEPPQISAVAGKVLKRLDRRAWLRYCAEHPSLQS